jgi:hypothetical protein
VKIKEMQPDKSSSAKFNSEYYLAIKNPIKRIASLQNKKWFLKKNNLLTADIAKIITDMVAVAYDEKKKNLLK